MLTRKKIEKLENDCTYVDSDGWTIKLDAVKFARLVEAEVLAKQARAWRDHGPHGVSIRAVADELKANASAARRAAKESR